MEYALTLAIERDACVPEGVLLTTATALGDILNKAGGDC
jgi:hypothetical protein